MENFNRFNPVFARTVFVFAGEEYQPGDKFDAPPHIVQRMWFARKLTHVKTDDLKTDDLKTDDLKTDDLKTDDLKTDDLKTDDLKTDDLKTDDLKTDDLKTDPMVTLDHKGAGWYEVLMHGAVVSTEKIKGKQNAIDWAVNTLGVSADDIGV